MARSTTSILLVTIMLASSFSGLLPWTTEPAEALDYDVTTTEDFLGSGDNVAIADNVVIEDDGIKLATETFSIKDVEWSTGNVNKMTVDDQNQPLLARASHWRSIPGHDGTGTYAHTAVMNTDSSQILVFGGLHDTAQGSTVHSEMYAYDTNAGSWTPLASAPANKFFHTAVWASSFHMMIVWGGVTVDNQGHLLGIPQPMIYWPANNSWGWRAACPWGVRARHSAAWDSVNNQMLVVGGSPDLGFENVTNQLWAYRPGSNSWTQLRTFDASQARGGSSAVWDTQSDQLVVYGGRRGNNNPMSSVLTYDPSSNTWSSLGSASTARYHHSAAWDPVGNLMYVYGGITGGGRTATCYDYSPLANTWRQKESAPASRFYNAFVWDAVNAKGYNYGGSASGQQPFNSPNGLYEYSIDTPFETEGWLTSTAYDVQGIISVGEIRWSPPTQPSAVGPDAVRFQVASSSPLEYPSEFVGPDGTSNTYFTDPSGEEVGDHHFGMGRIAYRMYFRTDDNSVSPTLNSVEMDVYRYYTKGTYTSPVHDLGQARSSFEQIKYNAYIPPNANTNLVKVVVEIRTADNPEMGNPSNWEVVTKDDVTIGIPYLRYFQFKVTIHTDSQKRHLSPVFNSLKLVYNSPPSLALGQVDSTSGDRKSWFTYSVTYTDVDNDEPTISNVVIDGVAHAMSSPGLDFLNGAVYSYTTRLPLGEHDFYFEFSDGKNVVRDPPSDGVYAAPTVLNHAPVADIDFPISGSRFEPDVPIQFSGVGSTDPDLDDITYLWTSTIDGDLSTDSAFVARLSEGDHIIRLVVTDAHGDSNATQIGLEVRPYEPLLLIEKIYLDKPTPIEKDRVTVSVDIRNEGEATANPAYVEFLVNDVVVDHFEGILEVDGRLVASFTWKAEGTGAFLGVQVRHGSTGEVADTAREAVVVTPNKPPVIDVEVSPLTVTKGEPVFFINNGTSDPNNDALTFQWEFGDGGTSPEATTQYLYLFSGTFYVNLTVSDIRGGVSRETFLVVVNEESTDDGGGLSMTMLGALVIAVLVVIGLVAFVLARRRGGKEEETPETPPPPPGRRPLPPPPPDMDQRTASPYQPPPGDPLAGIPGSPLDEEGYTDPTAGIPGSPLDEEASYYDPSAGATDSPYPTDEVPIYDPSGGRTMGPYGEGTYDDPTAGIPGSPLEEEEASEGTEGEATEDMAEKQDDDEVSEG